jgi:hypothetical protein
MRLKVVVFMRSKASIIFDNFDQEVDSFNDYFHEIESPKI